jgi:hypothetical protein
MYIRDLRVVQGGVVPVANFTPGAAPFSYASPTYVANMGTTVFTLLGQFITYPPGKYGSAISIMNYPTGTPNTSTKNLRYPLNTTLDPTIGITISFWVYVNILPSSGQFSIPVIILGSTGYLSVNINPTNWSLTYYNGTTYYTTTVSQTLTPGWKHLACIVANGYITAYYNGTQSGTPTAYANPVTLTNEIQLGSNGGYAPTDALYDDLRIYNTALTAAQVRSIYSSQGAPAPSRAMPLPKLAWDFNGTTTDYVSGVVPTTTTGTPTYVAGKYGQAIQFTNSAGSAPTQRLAYPVSLSSSSGITASFWVQFNTYNTGFQTPFSLGDSSSYLNIFGTSVIYLYWQRGSNSVQASPGFSYSTGTWYHIALCYSAQTVTLYINGVGTVGTLYIGGTPSGTNVGADTTFTAAYAGSQNTSLAFNGLVVDLRIFDRALTSAQVQSIYNQQGVPGRGVQTNTRGILDVMNTPTAAAFSLRQLTSTYTGPVVQIRRQSDLISNNFVADFSGNLSNVQNGTTLQTFLTSTYGNVTTWYDQSGNGRNASQASATNAPVIIQTSNLNMKWALTTTYANPNGSTFLSVSGGTFLNATDFTIMSTSRRTITSNSKTNNALYAYGANSSWQSYTSNVTYPDNSRFVCEFPYQGNRATWNQRANPQNAEAFANIPYYIAGSEPVTYLSLVSKGSINQTTLYHNNAVASTTAAYAQCNANVLMTSAFTIGGASAYGSFGGEIGELIIFPSALTAAQVSQNYNSEVKNSSGGVVSLTGTPLFTQLSQSATSSAVGAFSLRAVNGTSARAVNVAPGGTFPPSAMTQTGTNSSTQTLGTGGKFQGSYIASSSRSNYGWGASGAFALQTNSVGPYIWQVGNYPVGGGTVATPTTTTTGATNYNGEWLQFQTPFPINLTGYSAFTNHLTSVVLLASTTGATSSWTFVDSKSAITVGSTITNTGLNFAGYSYFRFVVITSTINYPLLGDVRFFGTVPSLTQDFYADRLGNLLTAPVTGQSLANWLGGATGYVTTWYDQSGRGNHATQLTAANQPIIQRATKGPGYMVVFNGVNGTTNFGLNFGTYNLLNNTSYSTCGVVRRTASGESGATNNENCYLSGSGGTNAQDQKFHSGYRTSTVLTLAHYSDDMNVTIPAFTAAATEPINYNLMTLGTDKVGRIYSYSGGTLYPTPTSTRTYVGFLNHAVGTSFSIGGGLRQFTGEIYELLVFTQSLYDLDNTGGLITKIYQNQLGAYGT